MSVDLIYEDIGFVSLKKHKTTFRQEILKIGEECDGIILGTCSHNDYPPTNEGGLNPSGVIRKYFDLYANVRPAKNRLGKSTKFPMGIDCIVMRENTERPEAITAGTAKLIGSSVSSIIDEASNLIDDKTAYQSMANKKNPYGDGTASTKILNQLKKIS